MWWKESHHDRPGVGTEVTCLVSRAQTSPGKDAGYLQVSIEEQTAGQGQWGSLS